MQLWLLSLWKVSGQHSSLEIKKKEYSDLIHLQTEGTTPDDSRGLLRQGSPCLLASQALQQCSGLSWTTDPAKLILNPPPSLAQDHLPTHFHGCRQSTREFFIYSSSQGLRTRVQFPGLYCTIEQDLGCAGQAEQKEGRMCRWWMPGQEGDVRAGGTGSSR